MQKYIDHLLSHGAFAAKEVNPTDIITAPWVEMKCRYGCPRYGHNRSCPPFAPDYCKTAQILSSYTRAIIFGVHEMATGTPLALDALKEAANDGHYRALGFGTGPCTRCKQCTPADCPAPHLVLPSPEACGIDVVATVRRAGFTIEIPPTKDSPLSCYGLLLIE